jgi:creatinine amidohydrolase
VVACPLTRRWARTLSAEFKSGACHAGRYETSIVWPPSRRWSTTPRAPRCRRCRSACREQLGRASRPSRRWASHDAYAGDPAAATAAEGAEQLERLAEMIVGELAA